ncbi:hypothetical protein [Enterocloster citroniae]|uniref:Uncharacterized protein n=2 Tax=Enterocloster citroniae TaxID=358743 RepID=A0A0J9BKX7_9FIRM|nr:hypothetical protein [Enterocloster citroniae]KMW13752.1 hypothetical protein HMPREF9470_05063 [[Clostridium] citroniae WAL-19142]
MATVDEILTKQAYAAGDETWTKDNNYPSYTMYAEPEYVPVTNKRIADFNDQVSVRGEQNAQFVGFQLPRYDDAMDLTKQNLYIHYQTAYGGSDGVPCNVSWSDNYVRMCWMIPGQATQQPEAIQMMIYATGTNSVGDRTVWKTLPATYTIHDGLEIGGGIPEPDQSWYEQFVQQMEGKVSTAQGYANDAQASKVAAAGSATAAAQSADASAQALQENKDYVESQKETFVGYNKRETDLKYANALIGSASGTGRVSVGDAWEAPIPDLEVAGKSDQFTTTGAQLFNASKIPVLTAGGATVVGTADGGYRISGSGDLTSSFYETVKITDISMLKPGNIMLKSEATVPKLSIKLINSSSATLLELSENQTKTITEDMLNTEGVYLQYMLYGPSSRTITPGTYYPMLYQDGDGTWEPYTGGQPSPSPDYPQEIVGTDVTAVTVLGDDNQSKTATIQLTAPLHGIGEYRDRITMTKRIDRCVELIFDGSEDWRVRSWSRPTTSGFYALGGLPEKMRARPGLCNQGTVTPGETEGVINQIWLGSSPTYGSVDLYVMNNSFYNPDIEDKGLAAWKAHLASHPLKIVTYLDTPVETDLPAATQTALNALTTFTGTTHITITAGGPEPDVAVEYVQDTKAVIADLQAQINAIRNGGTT